MALYFKFLIAAVLLVLGQTAKLPSYITPCKRYASDLNQCAIRNGQQALSTIVQGDKSYKIPNMLPLKIPYISFDASRSLKITMKNAEIYGLETAEVKNAVMDVKKQHFKFAVFLPRVNLQAEYDINGRILILPIQGHGPANITMVEAMFTYDMDYVLRDVNGEDFIEIKNNGITYTSKRTYFHLANLFNGDKRLGDEMNRFLDENWREVSKDIGPALTETISQIITSILTAIVKKVPYNEFLPE